MSYFSSPIARPAAMETPAGAGVDTAPCGCGVGLLENHTDHRAGCGCRDCICVRQDKWAIVVSLEEEAKLNAHLSCAHCRWRSRSVKGMWSADPECTPHSYSPKQKRQSWLTRRPSPPRNLWFNRQRQWGWVSALSYSFCLLRLSLHCVGICALKLWLVKLAKNRLHSNCLRLPREACMELSALKPWVGQACRRVGLYSYCLQLPRDTCFDLERLC